MNKRFQTITLGCRVNQYESESIAAGLQLKGWLNTKNGNTPNLVIINTCTVTGRAAMQSRQAVRHAIREFPDAAILVTGCYAQSEPDVFADSPGVNFIIGNTDKHRIPDILEKAPTQETGDPYLVCRPIHKLRGLPQTPLPASGCRARPYLKIQDGCEDFCSYCIVPYTRGPSRSLPPETVMHKIGQMAASGAKEAVLTGIHLGRYGFDLSPRTCLHELLQKIDDNAVIDRIRLSSIEPKEITAEIIQMAADTPRIRPHFHIPLQSGDPDILKKMKRPYTPALFKELVLAIHEKIRHAAIGVDILVGFPGEHEQAFANTFYLLESLPITYLHVFPFSPRPQTPASRYPYQINPKIIKYRCARLRELSRIKKQEFYQKQVGRVTEVILENHIDADSRCLKGVSANYLNVLTDGTRQNKNIAVNCLLTGPVRQNGIVGKII